MESRNQMALGTNAGNEYKNWHATHSNESNGSSGNCEDVHLCLFIDTGHKNRPSFNRSLRPSPRARIRQRLVPCE